MNPDGIAAFLLRETGLRAASVARVAVRSRTANYRAALEDGRSILVKSAPAKTRLARVDHPLAPRDLFPDRDMRLDGRRIFCMEWKEGRAKTLDALSDGELASLLAAHASFLSALGEGMVHGDFNCNNVLFADGKVSAILDLEAVRAGHPCEDWARYALTGAERLPVCAFARRRRTAEKLARVAAAAGFGADAWRAAIDGYAAAKRARKERKGPLSLFARANLAWRRRFCEKLKEAVA